jgi:hypothetical protein
MSLIAYPGRKEWTDEYFEKGERKKIQYSVKEEADASISIEGKSDYDSKSDPAPSQAALGQLNLRIMNSMDQTFRWSYESGYPTLQRKRVYSLLEPGKESANLETEQKFELTAGNAGTSSFSEADLKGYVHVIDLSAFKNRDPLKMSGAGSGSGQAQSLDSILGDVRQAYSPKGKEDARDRALMALSDAVRTNSQALGRIRDDVLSLQAGDRMRSVMIGAIGARGDAEGQAALESLYRSGSLNDEEKQKVLTHYAINGEPLTQTTKSLLKEVYESAPGTDLSNTAMLAVGSSIRHDGDPDSVGFVKRAYRQADGFFGSSSDGPDQRELLLNAMGNSRSNVFDSEVKSELGSSSAEVRAAAMDALRFPRDNESRTALEAAISKEQDLRSRAIGFQALGYQPFDERTKGLLSQCVNGEAWANVRLECYRILVTHVSDPWTQSLLSSRLGSETESQLKELIQQALDTAKE